MKYLITISLIFFIFSRALAQDGTVSVINDTTELHEYSNGQKLKVNFRLNGQLLTIKQKNNLLTDYPGISQEFNIKTINNENFGEINFLQGKTNISLKNNLVTDKPVINTLDISEELNEKQFPSFSWRDIDSNLLSLANLKGKVVVLNFWHTSCVPCVAEMPLLNELVNRYKKQEVFFISVTPNTAKELHNFLSKREFTYRHVPAVDTKTIFSPFPGWPIHVVLNRNGIIQFYALGKQDNIKENLMKSIDESLQKQTN